MVITFPDEASAVTYVHGKRIYCWSDNSKTKKI